MEQAQAMPGTEWSRAGGRAARLSAVALLLCIGLPPLLVHRADAMTAVWVWLALVSAPVGAWVSGRLRVLWVGVCAAVGVGMAGALAHGGAPPWPAWVAVVGLVGAGNFVARAARGLTGERAAGGPVALGLLCVALVLEAAPLGFGIASRPPASVSATAAARAFDLAPATLVLECAGTDWMRHPSRYDAAGTDWFSDRRRPYRAELAGGLALVVGCLLAGLGAALFPAGRACDPSGRRHLGAPSNRRRTTEDSDR